MAASAASSVVSSFHVSDVTGLCNGAFCPGESGLQQNPADTPSPGHTALVHTKDKTHCCQHHLTSTCTGGCAGAWLKLVVADTNQAAEHADRKLHKKTIEKRRKPAASTVWPFIIPSNSLTLSPQNALLRLSCHCLASVLSTSPGPHEEIQQRADEHLVLGYFNHGDKVAIPESESAKNAASVPKTP